MHKLLRTLLLAFFLCNLSFSPLFEARGEMDPRAKALASMTLYGTIGGLLLGVASQAFDVEDSLGRSMAKGASLGLYTGLLFGSYVVISHYYRTQVYQNAPTDGQGGENYYPDDSGGTYEGGGNNPYGQEQRWIDDVELRDLKVNDHKLKSIQLGNEKRYPVYYLNLINMSF